MTSVSSTVYSTASRYASDQSSKAGQDSASRMDVHDRAQDRSASLSARSFDSRPSGATASFHGLLAEKLTIDLSMCEKVDPLALPEADYQVFMEQERRLVFIEKIALEEKYTAEPVMPDLSNEPRLKAYANVVVGGTVVATIDNQGIVGSRSDEILRRLTAMLTDGLADEAKLSGPTLAQDRANKVAALLGGTVEKSTTAMTQSRYDALPPLTAPERVIDTKAMMTDPLYATLEQSNARIQAIEASRTRSMESLKV